MSYTPNRFNLADGPQLDAFGRLRSSSPQTLFYSGQEYKSGVLVMENYTAGGGTAVYAQATASTVLSTAAATAANRALRQSKVYFRYQPGKSQVIKLTGTLAKSGTPTGAAVARIGYFDDRNGVFFGRDATGYFVAIRTDVSGSVLETEKIYQANWNLDTMLGTGPSKVTANFTKEQIFFIDFQWLGVGRVRVGLVVNGTLNYVHQFMHANTTTAVYIRTPHLPVRYEVFNDGGSGSDISMECICAAVESEGGVSNEGGYQFEIDNSNAGVTCANSATLTPVMTIRLRDTFQGLTFRGQITNLSVGFLVTGNPAYYEWQWNVATLTSGGGAVNELTAGTWINANTDYSGLEYNLAATATAGPLVSVSSGYVNASGSGANKVGADASQLPDKLILGRTYANVRDTLTLAARGIGGAAVMYATVNYEEQR